MILVDSNIPMYLVGAEHRHKTDTLRLLERAATESWRLVTDAEVLQEILHRCAAIGRRDAIQPAFDALLAVVEGVFPIRLEDAERAKALLTSRSGLSARDAIHVAVMQGQGIEEILSFDAGFDGVPGIRRIAG